MTCDQKLLRSGVEIAGSLIPYTRKVGLGGGATSPWYLPLKSGACSYRLQCFITPNQMLNPYAKFQGFTMKGFKDMLTLISHVSLVLVQGITSLAQVVMSQTEKRCFHCGHARILV